MMQIFALIFVAALAMADDSSSGTRKQCPGGYTDGNQMNIGRYWYECRDGQVVPKGCLDEEGNRVEIDRTFDTKQYRMQCVLDKDGFLAFTYKACMQKGVEHEVGSQWDDGTAFFTCVKEGDNVRLITLGCFDQGKPLKLDERVIKGDFIYQCKKVTDGTPKVNKVGCVINGHKYNIGETHEDSKFWYTCTDSGSKIVGCVHGSNRLQQGDRYTENGMVYSCKVDGENSGFEPFACMQQDDNGVAIERRVGCFFVEGRGSEAYEYTCKADSSKKLSKVPVKCVYRSSQGMFKLDPGCIQSASDVAVGCVQEGDKLRIQTFGADQINNPPAGLHKC